MRLTDLYRGGLSLRLLWVLVQHLGRESELAKSLDPDVEIFNSWSTSDYLIARLIDQHAASVNWQQKPPPVQRPTDIVKARERRRALEEQVERVKRRQLEGSAGG